MTEQSGGRCRSRRERGRSFLSFTFEPDRRPVRPGTWQRALLEMLALRGKGPYTSYFARFKVIAVEGETRATMLLSILFEVRAMKLTTAVVSTALLSLATLATAQTDEEVTGALSNLHYEMSRCIAYYMIVQECVHKEDPNLGAETAKVKEHLIDFSVQIGTAIGMTEDAMASRITAEQGQMRSMIRNNCVNIHSLYVRHAMRCKQVVENGDSVLFEYLGPK